MDRKIYLSILAAFVTAGFAAFVVLLILPLAEPLVWALIIGISTYPHYDRIARRFPGHQGQSAGVMVVIITLCIILPAGALVLAIATNATDLYHQSQELIQSVSSSGTSALSRIPFADRAMDVARRFGIDLTGHAAELASAASKFLLNAASGAVRNVAQFVLTMGLAIFFLYFVYRDGRDVIDAGVRRFATDTAKVRHYLNEIGGTTTAVVVGTVLTCLVQGAFAGVGYFFAGLPAPILCGVLTAIGALVPVVGTAIVWAPLAAYLAITGAYMKAALLAGWCIVFVGIADNAIRPLMVGTSRDIPTLAIVFGAIGGAALLGLLGLIVGPIVFAILVTLWRDMTRQPDAEVSGG